MGTDGRHAAMNEDFEGFISFSRPEKEDTGYGEGISVVAGEKHV